MRRFAHPVDELSHRLANDTDLAAIMEHFVTRFGLTPFFFELSTRVACGPHFELLARIGRRCCEGDATLGAPSCWRSRDGRILHGSFVGGPRSAFFFLPEVGSGLVVYRAADRADVYVRFQTPPRTHCDARPN